MPSYELRKYLDIILEANETADDLFRKLDSLNAMINDSATTEGEKANARSLKAKIEQKLKDKFPNATRSQLKYSVDDLSAWQDFAKGYTKAHDEYKRYQQAKDDPTIDRGFILDEIERLKQRRKELAKRRAWGDVEANRDYKDLTYKIERLYKEFFPDEWGKIVAKRDSANYKAGKRAHAKRQEKMAKTNTTAKESGLSFAQAAKNAEPALKRLHANLKGSKITTSSYRGIVGSFISGRNTLWALAQTKTTDLRKAFQELDKDDQTAIRDAVESVHTKGYVSDSMAGYTEVQKKKVLNALTSL